ncbi:MAG: DUF4375 domain-containing protein [Bacteroidia bacterium]|nr:DUF4375 domain-containing protein [Bacteroidia bacterium]
MKYEDLINKKFDEAVGGIDARILSNFEDWYNYVENLPVHLRITYMIIILNQQVFNGGFHQYFFNGYGGFGYLTLESLRIINAGLVMDLLENVLESVNDDGIDIEEFNTQAYSKKLFKVVNFDEELMDYLEKCDDEYYDLEEDLMKLLGQYLESI